MLDIEILEFNEENIAKLEDLYFHDKYDISIFRNIAWNINILTNGSGYIFIESDYLDRDFSEDFSAFFSTTYGTFDKRCVRLHFFKNLDLEEGKLEWPIDIEKWPLLQDAYLGFTVILPLSQKGKIGRTVIKPFPLGNSEAYCCTNAKTSVNILGVQLTAYGMPFKEQDGRIGVCATVAMWVIARYMHLTFGFARYSPSDITRAANKFLRINREFPANRGLQVEQMVSGLVELGYTPLVYDKETFLDEEWNPKEIIYKYVESAIPTIIIVNLGSSLHASVVIGHDFNPKKSINSDDWLISNSEFVDNFIVHDDTSGLYLSLTDGMPLVTPGSTSSRPVSELTPFEIPQNRYTPYTIGDIVKIIVPSFKKVYLEGQDIEILIADLFSRGSSDFLTRYKVAVSDNEGLDELIAAEEFNEETRQYAQEMHNKIIIEQNSIYYRAHIMRSNDFKKKYLISGGIPKSLGELYGGLSMSRYIWVVELALGDKLNSKAEHYSKREIFGEILIDATGSIELDSIISVHIPGFLMTSPIYDFDPDKDPDYIIYTIKNDHPYFVYDEDRKITK